MDSRMRDALFAGMFIIIGAIISPLVAVLLQSSNMPPVMVDFSPDLSSPQPSYASITWFANARDTDNDPIHYKFQLKGPSTGNLWKDKQDWSRSNSWTWNALKQDIGNNTVRVLVRDNQHVLSDIGDNNGESDTFIITKSSRDWYNEANAFLSQGQYNYSIQCYDKAIELNPNNASAWNSKGYAHHSQGKYDEAINAYNRAIEIDPQYAEALKYNLTAVWNSKGSALYSQGKYDEAINAYNRAIEIDPQYAQAWIGKGYAHQSHGNYDEAIDAYNRAIEITPQHAEALKYCLAGAWNSKGYALDARHKHDEAIQAFDRAIEIDQKYVIAWQNKGEALMRLNRSTEANDAFAKAKELRYTG